MNKLEAIQSRLDAIYQDLSYNITYIYERNDLHLAFDLVYHSVLSFEFQRKRINKGWVEALVVSDTRCGKSETAEKLVNHYRLGEVCSGENTSFAGLIGGMQQIGSRWHLTWGKIPLNDRRLVIIDEVSGMPQDIIALMSGIRSSGYAEIIKINIEKTQARTRLLWLSNPRQNYSVSQHNSGIDVVNKLIGKPEDVARFDFALIMTADDVGEEVINAYHRDMIKHVYTSDACHNLLLWAWSRKSEHIVIKDATVQHVLELTKVLCQKYSAEFPLVTVSEMKIKLIRMSVALAVRLFSTDDGERVIVEPEHVMYISNYLDRIYSKPCFGYDIWSMRSKKKTDLKNKQEIENLLVVHPESLIDCLLESGQITVTDIEEIIAGTRKEAKGILADLLSFQALRKKHHFYVKTPAFIRLLKEMLKKG